MSNKKGNLSLRLTETSSGTVASMVYRGPMGKRTVENFGFVDMRTTEGKAKVAALVEEKLLRSRVPRGAS